MPADFKNGNDMIGVLFCFQVEDQWWESYDTKRGCAKNAAFET
jgi:hypothetical protein